MFREFNADDHGQSLAQADNRESGTGRMSEASCASWTSVIVCFGLLVAGGWYTSATKFSKMFDEMLGGEPLPLLTQLVIGQSWLGPLVVLLVSGVGIAAIWIRRDGTARWIASGTVMFLVFSVSVVTLATSMPLIKLIDALGG